MMFHPPTPFNRRYATGHAFALCSVGFKTHGYIHTPLRGFWTCAMQHAGIIATVPTHQPSRSDDTNLAVGFIPRLDTITDPRRVATFEIPADRAIYPIQPSLRDGVLVCAWVPWVETHGYIHTPLRGFWRLIGRQAPRHATRRVYITVSAH